MSTLGKMNLLLLKLFWQALMVTHVCDKVTIEKLVKDRKMIWLSEQKTKIKLIQCFQFTGGCYMTFTVKEN